MPRLVPSSWICLPPLPKWPAGLAARVCDQFNLQVAIRRHSASAEIVLSDSRYTEIPDDLVEPLIDWAMRAKKILGGVFVKESRDCDKFAKAFTLAMEWCAANAGIEAQPICPRISVRQAFAWANVPAGGGHALCAIATAAGKIWVVEPQNGQKCLLEAYPNRAYVFRVSIGG